MNELKNYLTFSAELKDDSVEDERGNITAPNGMRLIGVIRDSLQADSYDCSDIDQYSFYGWHFKIIHPARSVSSCDCILQKVDEWLLILDFRTWFMSSLFRSKDELSEVCEKIQKRLSGNSILINIKSMTRSEFMSMQKATKSDAR